MKKIIIKGEDLARIPLWKTLGKPKDDEEIILYQLEDDESFPVDKPVGVPSETLNKFKKFIEEQKDLDPDIAELLNEFEKLAGKEKPSRPRF